MLPEFRIGEIVAVDIQGTERLHGKVTAVNGPNATPYTITTCLGVSLPFAANQAEKLSEEQQRRRLQQYSDGAKSGTNQDGYRKIAMAYSVMTGIPQ